MEQQHSILQPNFYLTIDEGMAELRRKIGVKTYCPRKPERYGVLLKCINDALLPYTLRADLYAGIPSRLVPGRNTHYVDTGIAGYVLKLVEVVSRYTDITGINITMDRLYRDIPLATKST